MSDFLPFKTHPLPWRHEPKWSVCGNGGDIAAIVDAKGQCVTSSHGSYTVMDVMWAMYLALTPEQEKALGADAADKEDATCG